MHVHSVAAAASAAALLLALPAASQDLAAGRWVDLTHPFNEDSVYWPTAEMFETRAREAEANSAVIRQLLLGDEKGHIADPVIQTSD